MLSFRSVVISVVVAIASYQIAAYYRSNSPDYYLPVQEGDAIVVTGAHTGIGKHAALTLAKEGFTVFCGVRKLEDGEELLQSAAKFAIDLSKIKPILLDVTNPEQIEAAVQQVQEFVQDRGLYGLFNNAGTGAPITPNEGRSVEHGSMESTRWVFDVNYFGLLQVTQAFLPLIRQRGGRVLSNTSVGGIFAGPFGSPYQDSKFAVEALMDALRRELLGMGVSVSILEPGFIQTPMLSRGFERALEFQGVGVYAKLEVATIRKMAHTALTTAVSPKVTSEAVVHAFRSPSPKIRYVVGGMSAVIKLFSLLPDSWMDVIVAAGRNEEFTISADVFEKLSESVSQEFDL
ncbi:hypothetical protein ACA910_015622 [Epithemia clementina (nom. ined.)]